MNRNDILTRLALQNGVSVPEIRKEIEQAIKAGMENPDPEVRESWHTIPRKGKIPTVEEVIDFFSKAVKGEL